MAAEVKKQAFTSKLQLTDEEILNMGIPPQQVELFRRYKYREATHLDHWLEDGPLVNETFRTERLVLSFTECGLLINHCKYYRTVSIDDKPLPEDFEYDEETKTSLSERIQNLIDEHFPNGYFVKLNSRSPKDSPNFDHSNSYYQELYTNELDKVNDVNDPNAILTAFIKFQVKCSRCSTVDDFWRLFGASYRVQEDLTRARAFGPEHCHMSLEFREFHPTLPDHPEAEFRCFVHKKTMNAISQYFDPVCFPVLVEHKQEYADRILAYFDTIKDLIPIEDYVIDIVCLPEEMFIIELNPFYVHAGAACFSWKEDREIFLNGPFEIRVREEIDETCLKFIAGRWTKFTEEYIKKKKKTNKCIIQ